MTFDPRCIQWPQKVKYTIFSKTTRGTDCNCKMDTWETIYALSFGDMVFDPRCTEWPQKVKYVIHSKLWELHPPFALWTYRKSKMGFHLVKWKCTDCPKINRFRPCPIPCHGTMYQPPGSFLTWKMRETDRQTDRQTGRTNYYSCPVR